MLVAGLNEKADSVKANLLLTHNDDDLLRIYNALDSAMLVIADDGSLGDPSKDFATVL